MITRILAYLAFLFLFVLPVVAQRPEPELEGYLAPDGSFITVATMKSLAWDSQNLIGKYLQVYAAAPTCSRAGQMYYDSALGHMRVCTAAPATWETLAAGGGGGITIGTTAITSGTSTRVLYDDAGVIGEDAGFTYVKATDILTVGVGATGGLLVNGPASTNTVTFQQSGTDVGAFSTVDGFQTVNGRPFKIFDGGSFAAPGNWKFGVAAAGISMAADGTLGFNAATSISGANDSFIGRQGAANIRHGAADAAAPVAQTLSVQSVVAGTANTAGVNFTITGSQSTGTGAGGSIIFQTAPVGGAGSSQNALATALTIDSTRLATFAITPAAPTQAAGTNSTLLATTAFVTAINNNSTYRTIMDAIGSITAGVVAGTYGVGMGDPVVVSGGSSAYPLAVIQIVGADYPTINGLATKLRIKASLFTNDVAPTGNYTFGLYPITRPGTSGGAGVNIYTLGTVVAGSNGASFTTPVADGLLTSTGSDFAIPADGPYVIGLVTTATVAASSHIHMDLTLQMRNP